MDREGQLDNSRPLVPFQLICLGQWYSAAVDLKSGGQKPGGGVKHRVMVTDIDPDDNTVIVVAASTFGGRSPAELHAAQGHGWRRQFEYLAFDPSNSPLSEYEVIETDPQVVTGWVNFLSHIKIKYSDEGVQAQVARHSKDARSADAVLQLPVPCGVIAGLDRRVHGPPPAGI